MSLTTSALAATGKAAFGVPMWNSLTLARSRCSTLAKRREAVQGAGKEEN